MAMISFRVALPGGRAARVKVPSNATCQDLKRRLANFGCDLSGFFVRCKSSILSDDCVFAAANFPPGPIQVSLSPPLPYGLTVVIPGIEPIRSGYAKATTVSKAIEIVYESLGLLVPDSVTLTYDRDPLPPDATLSSLRLPPDAVLRVHEPSRPLAIYFTAPDGRRKVLLTRYRSIAHVSRVRREVSQSLGVPSDALLLFYGGEMLEDGSQLGALKIPRPGFLEARLGRPPPAARPSGYQRVDFQFPNRELIRAQYGDTATIRSAKHRLAAVLDVPNELISLDLDYPSEGTLFRDVPLPVSRVVTGNIGLEIDTITSDTMLRDDASPPASPLRDLTITTWTGHVAKARYRETATVGKLKTKLGAALRVSPKAIRVPGADDDESLIVDLDVTDGTIEVSRQPVEVVRKFVLRLENGIIVSSRFRLKATIRKAKQALVKVLEVPTDRISLSIGGRVLDDKQLISELDVPSGGYVDAVVIR
jgi:hypothetical protein